MDVLWAPWRSKYIERFKDEDNKEKEECFFCEAVRSPERDTELYVVRRNPDCFVMLNKFPYNNGHCLIAPYRHVSDMDDLTDDEMTDIMFTLRQVKNGLGEIYGPHGFNIGCNLGRTAGAGVPGHLHFHIVPRWDGDASYMTVFAELNVVSPSLNDTHKLLSAKLAELYPQESD